MTKHLLILMIAFVIISCKTDKKESAEQQEPATSEVDQEETTEDDLKLPANTIQINKDVLAFDDIGLKITSIQSQDKGNDNYLLKIFIEDDSFEKYSKGNYSFFIHLFPTENDLEFLPESYKAKKLLSLSINLKNSKKYKGNYVLFKGFTSEISLFEKMAFGIYDGEAKQAVFRTQINDAILKN